MIPGDPGDVWTWTSSAVAPTTVSRDGRRRRMLLGYDIGGVIWLGSGVLAWLSGTYYAMASSHRLQVRTCWRMQLRATLQRRWRPLSVFRGRGPVMNAHAALT